MTLGEKQRLFSSLFAKLILFVYAKGYECSIGEIQRSDEQAEINALGVEGRISLCRLLRTVRLFNLLADCIANNVGSGIRNSLHQLRIAGDLNLYMNGAYLQATESYREFGEYWKSLNPLCRWGGDWGDGNHFSLEHEGRK